MNFINSSINGTNSSNVYHMLGLRLGMHLLQMYPLTGFGTSNSPFFALWSPALSSAFGIPQYVDVESSVLDLGIQLGIVGIVLYLLFVLSATVGAVRKRDRLRKLTVVWLLVSLALNCNVNYIFYDAVTSLLMFGCVAL